MICDIKIDPERTLLIRDLSVVGETTATNRPWVFSSLFARAVAPAEPESALKGWLEEWTVKKSVNGYPLRSRSIGSLISLWPKSTRFNLIPEKAPFRLAAIVMRPDLVEGNLRKPEIRFIYSGYNRRVGKSIPFTIIFEFELLGAEVDSHGVPRWAHTLIQLQSLPWGDPFNNALQEATEQLTGRLLQVRTNEFYLDSPWELREFHPDKNGYLRLAPTAQTPDWSLQNSNHSDFKIWAEAHRDQVLKGTYNLSKHFLGGSAPLPNEGFSWLRNLGWEESLRLGVSKNTCNGCHGGDTNTRFTHIAPRENGARSKISDFLNTELIRRQEYLRRALCGTKNSSPALERARVH
jgi:hypothetical protein